MSQQLQEAKSAVVTVGDGRGFIVNYGDSRLGGDYGTMPAVLH